MGGRCSTEAAPRPRPRRCLCCHAPCPRDRSNAADSDAEAHDRADALTRAGVILRLNSLVYLRPQEVAEMVYQVGGGVGG
jgi:hypothetical protein